MQLSTEFRFAFLCMPKCASTSIEAALSPYCDVSETKHPVKKHMNARFFRENVLPEYQSTMSAGKIEICCLMREPVEWVHSWYRFRSREKLKDPQSRNHHKYSGDMSFEVFVEGVLQEEVPAYAKMPRQHEFLRLGDGSLGVDYIFPLSAINRLEDYISAKVGSRVNFPERNVSPKIPLVLSALMKQRLQDHLVEDYKIYHQLA